MPETKIMKQLKNIGPIIRKQLKMEKFRLSFSKILFKNLIIIDINNNIFYICKNLI